MADAPVLALELLYEAVKVRFLAEGGPAAAQPFGWRSVAAQHVGPRIVWVPGNPLGAIGRIGPPRNPGGDPRSLGTIYEAFHVVISSQDPEDPEDEQLQYRTTRLLYDAWHRAVYHAAFGTVALESPEWLIEKLERRFGTALRVVGTIQAKIPDVGPDGPPYEDAPDDTSAEVAVTELDNTETLIVEST
jgi:hypothetical protein